MMAATSAARPPKPQITHSMSVLAQVSHVGL
jgi:hypothetical protein